MGWGRAVLEGLDPYDPDVWLPLRARYGSTWMPDERAPWVTAGSLLVTPYAWTWEHALLLVPAMVGLGYLALAGTRSGALATQAETGSDTRRVT